MQELLQLPSITFPVTMTCAGNRRKEVNMRKQTIGFNWQAALYFINALITND
jgi:nitrate reductase (NAD(P)H)